MDVDAYTAKLLTPPDPSLDGALLANTAAGLPAIDVSPNQGKFLHLLAKSSGARKILELGTLGGYSTIWLARALPAGGRLITIEIDPKHAEVARQNIAKAGVTKVVDLRLGPALDILPQLIKEGAGPFDLIFIDADKSNIPNYFAWALKLAHVGSLILVDNVVRKGAVIDADSKDPNVQGVRRFLEMLSQETRVTATVIQTVGSKGYDGFAIALVTADPFPEDYPPEHLGTDK